MTVLQTIFGSRAPWASRVTIGGASLGAPYAGERHRPRLGLSPAEGFVFRDLAVIENLFFAARSLTGDERRQRIEGGLDDYPILRERVSQLAGALSGGQQRMVSLAMALMTRPRPLLPDDPSLGLAPAITE